MPAVRRAVTAHLFAIALAASVAQGVQAQNSVPPTLEACYVPISGTLYRIDTQSSPAAGAPKNCLAPTHVKFLWNQQGVKGEKGDPGPAGANGANGADGTVARTSWGALDFGGLDGFVSIGTQQQGNPLGVSGAGTRAFWYPRRSAFRAGRVDGAQWDDAQIGTNSVAFGFNTIAKGNATTALGTLTSAEGSFSLAAGSQSSATGIAATALGFNSHAIGNMSVAAGLTTAAQGNASVAMGSNTVSSGFASFAMGSSNTASGDGAVAMGGGSSATKHYAAAIGYRASASGALSIAIGGDATTTGDNSMSLGGGARATGSRASAIGDNTLASGDFATALGTFVTASGHYSTAMGHRASTNGKAGAFVYGDQSTIDYLTPTLDHEFVVRASGGVSLYSNPTLTAGALLAPGGGSWQSVSDVRKKTAFRDLSGEDVLAKLRAMPVRSWQYKSQAASIRHVGPTAQDFRAAFGVGESDTTITSVDADGIALAAAKALEQRSRATTAALARVDRSVDAVRAENAALRDELADRQLVIALTNSGSTPAARASRERASRMQESR